uniref:Uncharacterized protein n=1 Tax=Glossina palpalis gambiensis TaxID=67801 RepID=A0A1B0BUI9_9MUSC
MFDQILTPACQTNVKILWISFHIGNERAYEIAGRGLYQTYISEPPCLIQAITSPYTSVSATMNRDHWNNSDVFLQPINPSINRPRYNTLFACRSRMHSLRLTTLDNDNCNNNNSSAMPFETTQADTKMTKDVSSMACSLSICFDDVRDLPNSGRNYRD